MRLNKQERDNVQLYIIEKDTWKTQRPLNTTTDSNFLHRRSDYIRRTTRGPKGLKTGKQRAQIRYTENH